MTDTQVLIVEDENIVAKDLKSMLMNLGYSISGIASSGEKAIKKAAETHPDLVIMDIKLKGKMDGVEAAKEIHERFDIPVVYLTAYADKDTLERAKITEPFGYVLKPFNEKELRTAFEMALYKYKTEKKLRESERWLSTVLRGIGDAVIVVDKEGLIKFMNCVAENLTGWKLKKALDKDLTERISIIADEEFLSHNRAFGIKVAQKDGVRIVNHAFLIRKEGIKIPIDYSHAPLEDDKGNFIGSVLVFRDITEKKESEKKLQFALEKLRKILNETIQAIALTVETRDPYTAGHQRRVSILASAIAEEMGLSKEQVEGILKAAAVHDIGKISVPSEILNKPGPLTELELNMIKTHPHIGYNILKIIEFTYPIARIVLEHHERMNGSGYPLGLSGERILLEARILGVADVVEAMSSHRPYRPALGIDKALQEISQKRDILYDPNVVDACLKLFSKKSFDFEKLIKPTISFL